MQHVYHIITLGCQMNKSDSERLETILGAMGMKPTEDQAQADVIIMNSCSVRQAAEDRIFGLARKFAKLKKDKPNMIVAVTGCMPGRDKSGKMGSKLEGVDLYFPTKDMINLPKMLCEINPNLKSEEGLEAHYLTLRPTYKNSFQAFVSIQTGCNHFCTYCVVPFARGTEVNRPLVEIMKEIQDIATRGYLEITLLGQIVNHYIAPDPEHFSTDNPYKESDFAKLLWEINQIEGIDRIHWTAPHPLYMTDEVIDAMTLPKQVNYIHLPVQSGNTEILKQMNRRHDRAFFIETIKRLREKMPDIAIGTDIIVGFCGESEEQFNDTVSLYKICDFDISYHAQYSTRSGTVAARAFTDDVPKEEKKRRWHVLQEMMEKIVREKNQKYLDKQVYVLVESCERGWCIGNSRDMKRVKFKGDETMIGTIQDVTIFKAQEWVLWGRLHETQDT